GGRVRLHARARCDSEETRLRVDRAEATVFAWTKPRNVVTKRLHLPPRDGGAEHGEVRFATGGREGRGDVEDATTRVCQLDDEHVLSEPAFITCDHRRDTQRK